jgi:hypothetical protein
MLGRGAQIVERQADDALQASKLPEVGEHTASVRAEFGV